MKKLLIGKIKLKSPVILAPMVDVTDLPFRLLCKKAGASLVYTEMLYADAIIHENKKTLNLMKIDKSEHPIGIQVTGNNPQEFEKLIKYTKKFDLIDINCGCPSIKLIGSQAGSYLLNDPKKIGEMIKILKSSGKPVTAKIRLGFKNNNVVEIAKEIEKSRG
jgi:tRNA-dihydrouridine synthase B